MLRELLDLDQDQGRSVQDVRQELQWCGQPHPGSRQGQNRAGHRQKVR